MLQVLYLDEKLQVSRDLTARRQQLKETREQHRQQLDSLDSDHSRQLEVQNSVTILGAAKAAA